MDKSILIAEDSTKDVTIITRVLEETRIRNPIRFVGDGAEVIAYLQGKGPFADREKYPVPFLLLLDLVMPCKSGLEVLEWMRYAQGGEFKGLGKIVMTAVGNIEEIQQAYRLGAHSFLIKPLRTADFSNLVHGLQGIRIASGADGTHLDFSGV